MAAASVPSSQAEHAALPTPVAYDAFPDARAGWVDELDDEPDG